MSVVRWNDSGWKDAGAELRRWKKMDIPQFVRYRARILAQDLIKWTPPRGKNPGLETWPQQKKRGEKTVERDCRKLFVPLENLQIIKDAKGEVNQPVKGVRLLSLGKAIVRAMRARDYAVLERLLFRGGLKYSGIIGNASEDVHDKAVRQGSRGRPAKHKRYAVIEKGSITELIGRLKKNVGRLKSGWGSAASALGVPPTKWPSWVQRHGANGTFEDKLSVPDRPTFALVNNQAATKDMSQAEIVDAAIAINERKMVMEAQKITKYEMRKLSKR